MNEGRALAIGVASFGALVIAVAFAIGWIVQRVPNPTGSGLWLPPLARSHRNALGQGLLVLAIAFWWMLLDAINRDLRAPFSDTALLATVWIAALALAYARRSPYALVAGLLALAAWLPDQITLWYGGHVAHNTWLMPAEGVLALLVYVVGRLHAGRYRDRDVADIYTVAGTVALAILFLMVSSHEAIRGLGNDVVQPYTGAWRATAMVWTIAVLAVGATAWALVARSMSVLEALGVLVYAAVLLALPHAHAGILAAFLFNTLAAIVCLGPLFIGYAQRDVTLINVGVGLAFVLIAAKYFDWFYSYLDRSLFFITAGVLLLVVGWLMERARRRMIRVRVVV